MKEKNGKESKEYECHYITDNNNKQDWSWISRRIEDIIVVKASM
jgi:hypothetical protein